eukprot:gene9219-10926_t
MYLSSGSADFHAPLGGRLHSSIIPNTEQHLPLSVFHFKAGGDHDEYRACAEEYVFNTLSKERCKDAYAQGLINDLVDATFKFSEDEVKSTHLPRFVIRYIHYCFLGLEFEVDSDTYKLLWDLYYNPSPVIGRNLVHYVKYFNRLVPSYEKLTGHALVGMDQVSALLEKVAAVYAACPALENYATSPKYLNQTKDQFAYSLTAVFGIAGLQ